MIKLFGGEMCPNCAVVKEAMDKAEVDYEYVDIYDGKNMGEYMLVTGGAPMGIPLMFTDKGLFLGIDLIKDELGEMSGKEKV